MININGKYVAPEIDRDKKKYHIVLVPNEQIHSGDRRVFRMHLKCSLFIERF